MQQGEGDDAAELKESPQDFALWKARKEGEDTYWESPWGEGRPGWHIECSAMAESVLGVDFEIHGGGSDLVFPHHENEIAQTEAARGKPLARIWMHNGMVQMGDEKMAKSVGNIRLLHGALEQFGRDAFLMWTGRRALPQAGGLHRGGARGRRAARWRACASSCGGSIPTRRPRSSTTSWSASSTPWPTTSTPPRPAPCCSTGWPRPTAASTPGSAWARAGCARCCTRSGSRACWRRDDERARGAAERSPPSASEARAARDFERADQHARRARRARLGGPRHRRGRRGSCAGRDRLRAQPRAGGAARHAARAARVRQRAGGAGGLARRRGDGDRRAVGARGALRLARPPGRLRRGRARIRTPTRTRCSSAEDALVLALDEVQDPHNLGAVMPGGRGRRLRRSRDPRAPVGRGHAGGLQGVGGRGGAPARGAGAQPRRLARSGQGAGAPGSTARPPRRAAPYDRPDYRGRVVLVLGIGGPRPAPAGGRRPATSSWPCRTRARWGRSTCPPPQRRWCTESCNSASRA